MTGAAVSADLSKGKGRVVLEYVLLVLCLCVIALRATAIESPASVSGTSGASVGGSVYSLSISGVLILAFVIWLMFGALGKRSLYRIAGIEVGLCIFCVGALVAGLAASDKRAAITNFVVRLAPILMAVLLVQVLDSPSRIRLVLVVIAALGVASAYECTTQVVAGNEELIEFYEQNRDAVLAQQNITPNSQAHWQFEHRLYTRGVRGFFTTSNSAGSFGLLACAAAIALFVERFRNRKSDALGSVWLVTCGIAVAAVLLGFVITRSKGAIIGSLAAAAGFVLYLVRGGWLKAHKRVILIACLLLFFAGGSAIVFYGLSRGYLPGGNSMLVRWQYWYASAQMYAAHWLRGIGPGNFGIFYPQYKPGAALESVADPHNFLLSVLIQYGPLGLVGFLAMIFVPLWRVTSSGTAGASSKTAQARTGFMIPAAVCLLIIVVALRAIRPIVLPIPSVGSAQERIAAGIILYLMPVAVFVVGFLLLAAGQISARAENIGTTAALLFCAVLGVLIHNLIDFAIFEPGVFTALWAVIACLIALDFRLHDRKPIVLKLGLAGRLMAVAGALVLIGGYGWYAWRPVYESTSKIKLSHQAVATNQSREAHRLLDTAAKDDSLSPAALSLNGRLYLQRFRNSQVKNKDLLIHAETCLVGAIERSSADFKNFERLAEVYSLLAGVSTKQEESDWLRKALDSAEHAVGLYPGCGRLHFKPAAIAEQLGKTDTAIQHYEDAIRIEDSYREQFRKMYPGVKVWSRLGQDKYQLAKQRIELLSSQPTP